MYTYIYTYIHIIYIYIYRVNPPPHSDMTPKGATHTTTSVGRVDLTSWGSPSTGPTPLFIVVVSPCRCEPLRARCCGGEGVLGVS